jgi:rSAM/selenodomain-associated transferase 1
MSMNSDGKVKQAHALVMVAKAPQAGLVKTRLHPYLTFAEAAQLYECLLWDIEAKLKAHPGSDFWIACAPEGEPYFHRYQPRARLLTQRGSDLGERLEHVFLDLFNMGYQKIVVADSDSPLVPLSSIARAYAELSEGNSDIVLGPCADGGYYLIGLKRPECEIFRDIPWSTGKVLDSTIEKANLLGLKIALLDLTYDIDEADAVRRLWGDFRIYPQLQVRAPRTYVYLKQLNEKERSRVTDPTFRISNSPRFNEEDERGGGAPGG